MADAARNAAREAQAAKAKAKLEQERLDEERRQAEDEAERKRIADEIVQKQKEAEEQGRREAAEAAKLKAELEVRQAAEAKAAMEAAAETKKQEEAEKAARRQAAQEQTEREAEESAKRIADALALKAKVEEAAKARGVEGADASNVWALSDEERAAILNDEGGTSVTNLAANVAPKKAPAPKQNRVQTVMTMAGMEDRLDRMMSRTNALKALVGWLKSRLQESLGAAKLKEDILSKSTDFSIEKTAEALDKILGENPGNALARIALGILCYTGCATSASIPKASDDFVGSLVAIRLFYEYVAWKEANEGAEDASSFSLSVEELVTEELPATEIDAPKLAVRESAQAFVLMLIKAYTTTGDASSQNPNGVSYDFGVAEETCSIIMSKFEKLEAVHSLSSAKVKVQFSKTDVAIGPDAIATEQAELDAAEQDLQSLTDKLAAAQKELALSESKEQAAREEAEKGRARQGAAKADLANILSDKKKIAAFFAAADKDGDGMVSVEEAIAMGMDTATFNEIDEDGNGQLTKEEVAKWQEKNATINNAPPEPTEPPPMLPPSAVAGEQDGTNGAESDGSSFASTSEDTTTDEEDEEVNGFSGVPDDGEEEVNGFSNTTEEHAF